MSFELALRLTDVLLGIAFLLQSLEHLNTPRHNRTLFSARLLLSTLLVLGIFPQWASFGLIIVGLFMLSRFQGPYNGGADRMSLLILSCLCLAHFLPLQHWRELALGYLALQLVLSYFISGWVKIINPEWRSGQALVDVFRFSAYPVSESLRGFAQSPRILFFAAWSVMLFELVFPLALFSPFTLWAALGIALIFHLANACLFGLNRFFWIWLAAYPSLLWLQQRLDILRLW